MTWLDFERAITNAGLSARQCSSSHWQVNGGQFRVNYYPTSGTVYVNGTVKGFAVAGVEALVRIAREGPPVLPKMASRSNGGRYRKFKRRWLRAGGGCHWCDKPLTRLSATLDHVVPLARGGLDEPDNWVVACHRCNQKRGGNVGPPPGVEK